MVLDITFYSEAGDKKKYIYKYAVLLPDIKPGLIQTQGKGPSLQSLHDPQHGWPLNYPDPPCKIGLLDDLTYVDGRIVEIDKYIDYYGKDISNIVFYVWHHLDNLYPSLNLEYYPWFHYVHREDAVKNNAAEPFTFTDAKEHIFLCLNMNRRPHRTQAVKLLDPFPSRLISYKAYNWDLPNITDWSLQDYNDANRTIIDESIILRNTKNLINLQSVYNTCQFSVVTETRYLLPFDFVTEKTTQCWLALHPALYVSNKGHVQQLRDWGFDVFDDVFDHSYDTVENDIRINTMIQTNKEVLTLGIHNYKSLESRLLANRDRYLNTSWWE